MKRIFFVLAALCISVFAHATVFTVSSPDGKTKITVNVEHSVTWSVSHGGTEVLAPSKIDMKVGGKDMATGQVVRRFNTTTVRDTVIAPFYKRSQIPESYSQLEIVFKNGFGMLFRAYDNEGAAYRFFSNFLSKGELINSEVAEFNFNKDYTLYAPYSGNDGKPFATSFESRYDVTSLAKLNPAKTAFSPVLVCLDGGLRLVITESDLESYPGMFLEKGAKANSLRGKFAPAPKEVTTDQRRGQVMVKEYTDYLTVTTFKAEFRNPRNFPWRALCIAENDAALPSNNLVYLLGSPNRIGSTSWIKPGKVAWDWWNNWNITGVPFKAGINTETYKYYIDFAAANGLEYVILDEGWSDKHNIMKTVADIDLQEIIDYGKQKNVGIVLWAVCYVLDKNLDEACKKYSDMGVKGFKIDFMNRDDQAVTDLLYKIAKTCANYKLIVDYHGMYKPAGMNRTFPNVLNFEGVWGLEQMKWSPADCDMVTYDVTFPFIRQVAGPVDYTQGAMRNARKEDYRPSNSLPESQGTRARQVAEYIVFDSPFVMLCDSPSAYMKEQETVDFIKSIPTVWDETRILQAEIGKYIITARRSGDTWYIGGMTDWEERIVTLDLGFIGGEHEAVIFCDGKNADRNATDYRIRNFKGATRKDINLWLAPGGGFAIVVK